MTDQKDEMDDLIRQLKDRGANDELCAAAATHLADQHAMWKDLKLKLEDKQRIFAFYRRHEKEMEAHFNNAQKRIKELEEHNKRLGQGDAEHYWEAKYKERDEEIKQSKAERDEALERLKAYRRLKTKINYKELLRKYISSADEWDCYGPSLTAEEQEIVNEIEREIEEESSLYGEAEVVALRKRIRELEAQLSSGHDA